MRKQRVEDIILPYKQGVPIRPSVTIGDEITHAIELMVNHNLRCIAVIRNNRPVGMVRLGDAFRKMGLMQIG